jgi:hypothetical protein
METKRYLCKSGLLLPASFPEGGEEGEEPLLRRLLTERLRGTCASPTSSSQPRFLRAARRARTPLLKRL